MASEHRCQGCGVEVPPSRGGPERKWCSARCRKGQYAGTCVDCGAPTNGYAGPGRASERCVPCRKRFERESATWTRERIIADGHRWRELTGRVPVAGDWNRHQNRGERRRLIEEWHRLTGPWPHIVVVQERFGSWRAFIEAIGGQAYPAHSGAPGTPRTARTDELRRLLEAVA